MAADIADEFQRVAAGRPPLEDDAALRAALGALIVDAVPDFYSLLPLEGGRLAQLQGEMIGQAGSEFENAAALVEDQPLAIVTWLPVEQLAGAQRSSTVSLMRQLDRAALAQFLAAAGNYSRGVEPIDGAGIYLSRVAVAPAARGRGLGRSAVQQVIQAAETGDVWLHVSKDNDPAIQLYRSLGFRFHSDAPFASRAMVRPGQTS